MVTGTTNVGTVGWIDLTAPGADGLREFYQRVVGWRSRPVDMGGYTDYAMVAPGSGQDTAGVCHARGINAEMPPVWLVYFKVADLDASVAACRAAGGEVLAAPRQLGAVRLCVIRDPAGAVCALYQG